MLAQVRIAESQILSASAAASAAASGTYMYIRIYMSASILITQIDRISLVLNIFQMYL